MTNASKTQFHEILEVLFSINYIVTEENSQIIWLGGCRNLCQVPGKVVEKYVSGIKLE